MCAEASQNRKNFMFDELDPILLKKFVEVLTVDKGFTHSINRLKSTPDSEIGSVLQVSQLELNSL
jgi:hypothetical protein